METQQDLSGDRMKRIWIIEDDRVLLRLLETALGNFYMGKNVMVESTTDGELALKIIADKQEVPDVVVLDLLLPYRSGFEVLEVMRSTPNWKKASVIVLSNLSQPEDMARTQVLGALDFIVKANVPIEKVVERINLCLQTGK